VVSTLAPIAAAHGVTPQQLAIAWLLHRSPAMLPIPGTTSLAHLRENVAAASVSLSDDEVATIMGLVGEKMTGRDAAD
jgi:aryl-alcohol dehydrogenase-like predicted oxidoreductase